VAVASAIAEGERDGGTPMVSTTEMVADPAAAQIETLMEVTQSSSGNTPEVGSALGSPARTSRRVTRCIPLRGLALDDPERRKWTAIST
jgi:hypothetical protein